MMMTMTPFDMIAELERERIPPEFHHAQHLEVAWEYLSTSASVPDAVARMSGTLRRAAAAVGHAEKYHHTVTVFWMRVLAAERRRQPGDTLADILRRLPRLLDKALPLTYYSPERLFSDEARRSWLDPDLRPLDADVSSADPAHSSGHAPDRPVSRPPA
jgi:hypothetical protein